MNKIHKMARERRKLPRAGEHSCDRQWWLKTAVAVAGRSGGSCWVAITAVIAVAVFLPSPRLSLLLASLSLSSSFFFPAVFDPFLFPFLSQKLAVSLLRSPLFFFLFHYLLSIFFPPRFGFPPSLSLTFVPFSFFSPLYSSLRVTIYRGRGSGVDPAPSHRCPCMGRTSPALLWRRARWPMEALLAGHDFSVFSS